MLLEKNERIKMNYDQLSWTIASSCIVVGGISYFSEASLEFSIFFWGIIIFLHLIISKVLEKI